MKAVRPIDDRSLAGMSRGRRRSIDRTLQAIDSAHEKLPPEKISPEIDRLMSFSYPYKAALKLKSKYSVSALNAGNGKGLSGLESLESLESLERLESLREPVFEEKELSGAARGSIYHTVLEHMDVGRTRSQGMDYLQVLMDQLVTDEILFPEEADMVDRTRLLAFAESSLGQRISGSRLVYRCLLYTSRCV